MSKRHHFLHTWIPLRVWIVVSMLLTSLHLQAQCVIACNQGLQLSLNQSGQTTVTTALIAPFAAITCPDDLQLTLTNAQNQPIAATLTCAQVNQTVQAKVVQISTGNFCTSTIQVRDNIAPTLSITDTIIACNADTSIGALGVPFATDNCTAAPTVLWISDEHIDLPCTTVQNGVFVTAKIKRTWKATDSVGNTAVATQHIWKKRNAISDIVFPPNRDGLSASPLGCTANLQDLNITGRPLIGSREVPIAGDCDLYISFSDQTIPICTPGTKKVLRTWSVTDYCVSSVHVNIQVIDVKDTVPPALNIPPNLTFYTGLYECSATVELPQTTAPDACSSVAIGVNWAFGTSAGTYQNIPKGVHIVTYKATDSCNNSTAKTMTITVLDNKPPIALCQTNLLASLGPDGTIRIPATLVNNGSYDNCSGVTFKVSKDATNYLDTLSLSCADIGAALTLTLRVKDSLGYTSHCSGTMQVTEHLQPTITCPPHATINCRQSTADTLLLGKATAIDNCNIQSLVYQDSSNLGACHTGTVWRRWKATDKAQNQAICTQIITVLPVQGFAVSAPPDITIDVCFGTDTTATGVPTWNTSHCGFISTQYSDEVLSPPASTYIQLVLRTWIITDNCIYNPALTTSLGQWTFVQKIYIIDSLSCQEPTISIAGNIKTESGTKVQEVAVQVSTTAFNTETNTTSTGEYLFEEVPTGGITTIRPTHTWNYMNGVSTYDIILILKHILGIQPLDSPYKIIAADVNDSKSVTSSDVVAIRKLILGISDTLPLGKSWRFVPAGHTFLNPSNPFSLPFPEQVSYQEPLVDNLTGIDFIASKMGDMNNNANAAQTRGNEIAAIIAEVQPKNAEFDAFSIIFSMDNPENTLEGFQLALLLDTSIYTLDSITYPMPSVFQTEHNFCTMDKLGNCKITMSWNTPTPSELPKKFTPVIMHVQRKSASASLKPFTIDYNTLVPEAYYTDEQTIRSIEMQYNVPLPVPTNSPTATVAPNPFCENTALSYDMPRETDAHIMIVNTLGQIVGKQLTHCEKGNNRLNIQRNQLQDPGIYTIYIVSDKSSTITGRLILLDKN